MQKVPNLKTITMKKSAYIRFALSFLLVFSLLSPVSILAMGDGKKYFKEGMKAESSEDWDKAVEQFALAVTENPKNTEYRLHYVRSLFNASQMYMRKGAAFANEKDYKGGYDAFRKAYAFDPTNELAKAEMERMARLYKEVSDGGNPDNKKDSKDSVKLVQANYKGQNLPPNFVIPQKLEELGDVGPFPAMVDLQTLIRDLARSLDLNVIFDSDSFRAPTKINIELKGVTAAKALDYIFLQQNLFFQKIGPRTIMVANSTQRQKFQQLVLRTFYLANASPKDVIELLGRAIPAQPGRTPTIAIKDDATNSVTIRDTAENIQLMGQLIKSLDKDRAEVVMDVAIYEVNKTDLLQLGNQIGNQTQLTNLAGVTNGVATANQSANTFRTAAGALIPQTIGVGLLIPAVNFSAFQSKGNSKLIASTQIHAFNNEESSARIGQRVPVRSATISNGFNNGGTNSGNGSGFVSDVINYEQVGLTLKFKPIVFPNQDVQVEMNIESKDVTGAQSLTPTFTERTIKGTARVQNNKTLLLASVAQNVESNSRAGLPLLGLIPILGRLFTAPTKDNRQVDIVIAVTPRVIRAPSILPEDEIERPSGSLAVPTPSSLEAMVIQEEIEEQLANARRLGNNTAVQLPDQKVEDAPTYVKSNPTQTSLNTETPTTENQPTTETPKTDTTAANIRPIDASNVKTLQVTPTSDNSTQSLLPKPMTLPLIEATEAKTIAPKAEVQFLPNLPEMKAGEKTKIAVLVRSATGFRSAILGLKFDAQKLAVRSISFGDVFGGDLTGKAATPFLNQNGKTYVSLSSPKDTAENASGILAYIEVEALADGKQEISFDADLMNIMTADGKNFTVKF